jgi:hypothetical protein
MHLNDIIMGTPQDHIMANTWRLIFERDPRPKASSRPVRPDFARLSEVLPEYRLIGLHLVAASNGHYRYE